ncbi:MAG: polymerase subunit epsilon, partial [Patescibacteria group bacterium]|nr:polymerase subunit epsilon [Patescibacteria group bacterium]
VIGDEGPSGARELFAKVEAGLSEYVEAPAPERPFDSPDPVSMLEGNNALEKRPEQAKMAGIVRDAIDKKSLVAIEAPTGIGKTFAYMVPAVASALVDGARVHVSTNTKTLQDQIAYKDVPKIRDILAPYGLSTFRFVKLKGRSNYASLLKLAEFSERDDFPEEAKLFFAKIAVLLSESATGELDEVSLYGKDYEFLVEIHSGDARVLSPDNPYRKKEPLFAAREAAKTADVVLVNHALILTELADDAPGSVGKLTRLIVDEAHNLEAAATDALTCTLVLAEIEKTFGRVEAHIRRHNRQPGAEKFLFPELKEFSESFVLSYGMALDFAERYAFVKAGSNEFSRGGYAGGRSMDVLVTSDFFTSDGISGMSSIVSSVFEKLKEFSSRLQAAPEKLAETFDAPLSDLSGYARLLEEFFSSSRTDLIKTISLR